MHKVLSSSSAVSENFAIFRIAAPAELMLAEHRIRREPHVATGLSVFNRYG